MPGDYFMLREAAESLDLSPYTLRKYIADDIEGLKPSKSVMFGKVEVYLYTREDIDRMRSVLDNRVTVRDYTGGGRPSKYSLQQRKDRARLFSRRHYWKRVRDRAAFFEDSERYTEAKKEIEDINKELSESEKH